ncbi:larval cuticle protein LCP-30 [Aethina tumida]|uniref:larval cuticle protein LCP-30 n=1 Tax=Aethina tumida TaxID=116153 RepID=UPI002149079E|nr:larval cuticle protein LCP-30 [Aethina tumida]
MKTLLVLSLCLVVCYADISSQYYDNSGQYIPDFSGQYIPDNSGQYVDDGTGRYRPDGSGAYKDNIERYRHVGDKYAGSSTNFRPTYQVRQPAPVVNAIPKIDYAKLYGNQGKWRILRQKTNIGPEIYHYEYETENKIQAEETGKLLKKGTKDEGIAADGFYEYVGPDNVKYRVVYTAGEEGFVPTGAHIPTPPPVPEPIARALSLKQSGRF